MKEEERADPDEKGDDQQEATRHAANVGPADTSERELLGSFATMRHLHVLIIAFILLTCGSKRRQLERAQQYETGGMSREAFTGYETLYRSKPKYVEAHLGMKRTAQTLLDQKAMDASGYYMAGDLVAGDKAYDDARTWKRRMDAEGLALKWDDQVDSRQRAARASHATILCQQADVAFRGEKFSEAESLAREAVKLDPTSKEAEYMLRLAQLEPRYREAVRAEELGLWRDAFRSLTWVTNNDISYKDAWTKLAAVREKATYTLAIVPLYNGNLYPSKLGGIGGSVEHQLIAKVKEAILGLGDPTIALIDRDNTDQLLAEQQRSMEGVYDDRYVVNAGRLMGAAHVLTPRILRFDDVLGRMIEVQVQVLDAETGRIERAQTVAIGKAELSPGNTRSQLLELASKRIAAIIAEFEPRTSEVDR